MLFTVSEPNFSDTTTYEREIVPRCPTWYIDNFMQISREKLSTGAQSDAQTQCVHEMPGAWMQTIFSRPPIESSSHVFLTNRNGKYNQHSFRIKSQHQGANIAFRILTCSLKSTCMYAHSDHAISATTPPTGQILLTYKDFQLLPV